MNVEKEKSEKIIEILLSPYSNIEEINNTIKLTGTRKLDEIILEEEDIPIIAKLLTNDNAKIKIGAVKLIGYFREKANPYIKNICENFSVCGEKEQHEIIFSLSRIETKEVLKEYQKILEKEISYDNQFNILFFTSKLTKKFPFVGVQTILTFSKKENIWPIIEETLQISMRGGIKTEDPKKELKNLIEDLQPIIGISEEAEKRRILLAIIQDNIRNVMKKLFEFSESEDKDLAKKANETLNTIKKELK